MVEPSLFLLLVTGSRCWPLPRVVWHHLDLVQAEVTRSGNELVVMHGNASSGVDHFTDAWAIDHHVMTRRYRAAWRKGGQPNLGAGFERNAEMVRTRPDMGLAFACDCRIPGCTRGPARHLTHGTDHCIGLMGEAGISVRLVPVP